MTKDTFEPSKPKGTGETRLKFDNKPKIGATDDAKKANPKLNMDMFNKNALSSSIPADGEYAAKSKKSYFDGSVFEHKSNEMNPTEDY